MHAQYTGSIIDNNVVSMIATYLYASCLPETSSVHAAHYLTDFVYYMPW